MNSALDVDYYYYLMRYELVEFAEFNLFSSKQQLGDIFENGLFTVSFY